MTLALQFLVEASVHLLKCYLAFSRLAYIIWQTRKRSRVEEVSEELPQLIPRVTPVKEE